jgi:hypothetical protein
MTKEQKIIRAKVGLLELARQLGNVSQACKMMATRATVSIASRSFTIWLSTSPRRSTLLRSRKGRAGEIRFLGDVENSPLPIERTIKRLADRYDRVHVCFEAGPT